MHDHNLFQISRRVTWATSYSNHHLHLLVSEDSGMTKVENVSGRDIYRDLKGNISIPEIVDLSIKGIYML